MNISGIRPYSGFYDYNSIQNVNAAATAEQVTSVDNAPEMNLKAPAAERDTSNQTYNAADYAKQYQADATYDLKGADSDIRSLDVEQAVSDLQLDQVLQQYQFFVGETRGQNEVNAATQVRATENFTF